MHPSHCLQGLQKSLDGMRDVDHQYRVCTGKKTVNLVPQMAWSGIFNNVRSLLEFFRNRIDFFSTAISRDYSLFFSSCFHQLLLK